MLSFWTKMIFKENCALGISGCLSGLCQHYLHQHQALAIWDRGATSSCSWAQTQSWSWCLTFIELLPLPLAFSLGRSPLSPPMCSLQGTAAPKAAGTVHCPLGSSSVPSLALVSQDTAGQPSSLSFHMPHSRVFIAFPLPLTAVLPNESMEQYRTLSYRK